MTRLACHIDQGPRQNVEDAATGVRLEGNLWSKAMTILFVVCDGVGGHAHGEVASALATEQIVAYLSAFFTPLDSATAAARSAPDAISAALREALIHANRMILHQVAATPALQGMATTAVCGVIVDGILYVAWAGDSRCYHFDKSSLRRVTSDHSQVAELVACGLITPEEAKFHPGAHTITRYLGQSTGFEPEVAIRRVASGDLVLLCTDGLTDVVPDDAIETHIKRYKRGGTTPDDLTTGLVQSALRAGTGDNVTVLVCDYQATTTNLNRTLTAAYAVEFAEAMQQLAMEENHE